MLRVFLTLLGVGVICFISAQNVGIGTQAPGAKLEINATMNEVLRLKSANFPYISLYSGLTQKSILQHTASDDLLFWSKGSGGFFFKTSAVNALYISSSGDVGVNQTTPTQKLHIQGNMRLTSAFYDGSNLAGNTGQILSTTGTSTEWIDATGLGGDDDWTVNGADMYPTTANNVGIGTTSPVYILDVVGNARVRETVTATADHTSIYGRAYHGSGNSLDTANIIGVYGEAITNSWSGVNTMIGVHGHAEAENTGAWGVEGYNSYGIYGEAVGDSSQGTQLAVGGYFTASGADNNYAGIFDKGNVGIGSTTPVYTLEVQGVNTNDGTAAVYAENVQPASWSGWGHGVYGKIESGNGYTVGVRGNATATSPNTQGRAYGIYGQASNANDGYNYGVFGRLTGSNGGGAITGWDQVSNPGWLHNTNGYWAGFFAGDVHVTDMLAINETSPTHDLHINGDMRLEDGFYDGTNSVGTAGQILSSTGSNTEWVDASSVGSGIVPIGSIIAWHKSYANTPSLPDGWLECDGTTVSDASSPYNGQVLPDLNGGNRFLMGNVSSGSYGGATTHTHSFSQTGADLAPDASHYGDGSYPNASNHLPPYMNIVWIMRIK